MSKTLKTISLLTILTLLAVGLVACGDGSDVAGEANEGEDTGSEEEEVEVYEENGLPVDEEVTLKMGFHEAGGGREWMDYAVETFTEKFPNVSFDITASPDIEKITGTKISAGDDDDMWDIFTGRVPGSLADLVEAGLLESVEDLWDHTLYDSPDKTVKELAIDGMYESAKRINGESYELSPVGSVGGLFFNKAMFEEHGWNQNPQTWEEFKQLLADIKAEGIVPITYPGHHTYYFNYGFGHWKLFEIAEMNGNLEEFEEKFRVYGEPEFLSDESVLRWERVYELGQKGYFPEGVAALDHVQAQMQIVQDKAAMVATGSWVENEMKDSAPDGFEWGFMAVPMVDEPGETIWVYENTSNGMVTWANKPELHKKWAKEFSVWIWNLDVQEKVAAAGGFLPVRKDFIDDEERASNLQQVSQEVMKYMDENNTKIENGFRTVTMSHPAKSQGDKVLDEAVTKIVLGEQDPMPILEEAEELYREAREEEGLD